MDVLCAFIKHWSIEVPNSDFVEVKKTCRAVASICRSMEPRRHWDRFDTHMQVVPELWYQIRQLVMGDGFGRPNTHSVVYNDEVPFSDITLVVTYMSYFTEFEEIGRKMKLWYTCRKYKNGLVIYARMSVAERNGMNETGVAGVAGVELMKRIRFLIADSYDPSVEYVCLTSEKMVYDFMPVKLISAIGFRMASDDTHHTEKSLNELIEIMFKYYRYINKVRPGYVPIELVREPWANIKAVFNYCTSALLSVDMDGLMYLAEKEL